jgi:hypothetical protein
MRTLINPPKGLNMPTILGAVKMDEPCVLELEIVN